MREGGRTRPYQQLLRVVGGLEGEVAVQVAVAPRFDLGAVAPWLRRHEAEGVFSAVGGDGAIPAGRVRSDRALLVADLAARPAARR
jgi:hypothetical protein